MKLAICKFYVRKSVVIYVLPIIELLYLSVYQTYYFTFLLASAPEKIGVDLKYQTYV